MSDTPNPPISPDGGGQPTAEPSPQPSPQERELGRVPSDAALRRRQEILLGPALFAADLIWDGFEYTCCFASLMLPLEDEIRRRAERHRLSPALFWKSVDRLMQKRYRTDSLYRKDWQQFAECAHRMQSYFQETGPTTPMRKLSKDQKRRHARMVDLLQMFIPLTPEAQSERNAKEALEILTALAKGGRGRKPDPILQQAITLHEHGVRGYKRIARMLLPNATSEQLDDLTKKIADAVRYRRKTSS